MMRTVVTQDGMEAVFRKIRADPSVDERRPQEFTFERISLRIKVLVRQRIGIEGLFIAVYVRSAHNLIIADRSVSFSPFPDQLVRIAHSRLGQKVDPPAE